MGRFIVVVLDSFGVGAMADVAQVRPQDTGANTALHILARERSLKIPHLLQLGLMNAIGHELGDYHFSRTACYGRSALSHEGADSFLGHQEIMGTTPKPPLIMPFADVLPQVEQALLWAGYRVRRYGEPSILLVNEVASVGDNLETDLGMVYNVTGILDAISFEELLKIGMIVRSVAMVGRVITFGGQGVTLNDLLHAYRHKENYAGVDAPMSGVYRRGYRVLHLGYGIDPRVQIVHILEEAGIEVALLGKVADLIYSKSQHNQTGVATEMLFRWTLEKIAEISHGFICLNIQETDLAGHAQDVQRYAHLLELSDAYIGKIIEAMTVGDRLIVMADHGNDPTIGHSNHTRECVPLLVYGKELSNAFLGERETMADVASTVADYFGVTQPEHGQSFFTLL
ncbi:phosphopentomutase [Entomospira culicis]|uniref:Phosphopentomutase n=1 Tax=Entomospira culicis TaxID=2719989 RepID=A0A968GIC2_9SPIO|nr:phosphopentomutase [Entomospira culicis]NIZ19586.1 phosphopentomutase [Entomospira culicis]NIZ69509.1 phosphopentomutase [Entomospira culicis]WDI36624.1 phosphopentomutase [Entomospira culicis]WDI38252.1 phosphopentomutase [Entomospira culicis]